MLLLTWSPELTIPRGGPPRFFQLWSESGWYCAECQAFEDQVCDGYNFGFFHFRDVQNNAALGDMNAIYALHMFKVYLIAERLFPS